MTAENGPSPTSPMNTEAASEPSMDDILASIRRIIADDDILPLTRPRAGPPPPGAAPLPAAAPSPPPVADGLLSFGQRLLRGGERVSEPARTPAPPPAFRPPAPRIVPVADHAPALKLLDFASTVPEPAADMAKAAPAPKAPLEPAAKVVAMESAPRDAASAVIEAPRPAPAPANPPQPAAPPRPAATPQPAAPAAANELPPPAPVAGKPSEAPRPAVRRIPAPQLKNDADEPVLLSSASGARVGASFEALVESLMLRDPEMIERVTREVLRPMLKAWLDDNLPVVVERLVRAEIERIARGQG